MTYNHKPFRAEQVPEKLVLLYATNSLYSMSPLTPEAAEVKYERR